MKRHQTAELEPTLFGGRYTLVRRLAVGGMAEIYLARQAAMAGFEKAVVVKRLRADLTSDPRVVEMFLDEARIGALLNHPNIVHVYDVDEHEGVPYIAMEYIAGEELNELCRRGIAHDRFLPLEHAIELMRQAAAGMGYFHARRGALADQALEIVHLDISPSNLLVTQDGFLKIIDFGIANARGQRQRTDVIPGKLGYMSPEQAARRPVDHRSDIFSLGIVLYEITVGKRLFRGSAQDVIGRLVDAKVDPPTFVRRTFPSALEAIVMRALEKHPDARYQSAYDLADDLEAFLRDARMHSGPVRIARYLDGLTHAAGGARRPELVSEAESRGAAAGAGAGAAELDFDSKLFDGFAPGQAKEWEDAEQPEADVAAALGLELAELRALRTPVPGRSGPIAAPPGAAAARKRAKPAASESDEEGVTVPLSLIDPSEIRDGDGDGDGDGAGDAAAAGEGARESRDTLDVPTLPTDVLRPAVLAATAASQAAAAASQAAASAAAPTAAAAASAAAPAPAPAPAAPEAAAPASASGAFAASAASAASGASVINPSALAPALSGSGPRQAIAPSAYLPPIAPPRRPPAPPSLAQRLPWIMVGALGVAVLALVAYIVLGA